MTWLQDVVPNHMVYSMSNQRLADVLERGAYSQYFNWFVIDWLHPDPELHGRVNGACFRKAVDGVFCNRMKLRLTIVAMGL